MTECSIEGCKHPAEIIVHQGEIKEDSTYSCAAHNDLFDWVEWKMDGPVFMCADCGKEWDALIVENYDEYMGHFCDDGDAQIVTFPESKETT